ncbi:MAG: glutamine cyclotransferase [Flavobacterium sp.]|nr:MAG: glutamine cyclotransferase [Flavobacterium sp.]
MKIYKLLLVTALTVFLGSCEDKPISATDLFDLSIKDLKKTYTPNDSFIITVNNYKNTAIDSVVYLLNNDRISSSSSFSETIISLKNQKLGNRSVIAKIYADGNTYNISKKVTILSNIKPKVYSYKILEEYPHDNQAYTQGLEFFNNILYESTGQYKNSSLRKTNFETGEVYKNVPLEDAFFGEGLTIHNNKIYQLTWQEKTGFIYDLQTLEKTGTFVYNESKEGWGLCNNGKTIYKSDGTQKIWKLNPNTLAEEGFIEIYTNTSKIKSVNELEWVEGKIYANIYLKDAVAIVNPANGAVEGVIDFTTLKNHVADHKEDEVLNGIAYKGEPNILYVTGKNWDKLFKVEIVEQ